MVGNSGMNIAMTKLPLLVLLLLLSITPPTDQLDCPLNATETTQEFPGVFRFPIPPDPDSIPPGFRALVGAEFTRSKDHQYPTVHFCADSVLVINRTSPLSPFPIQLPYPDGVRAANFVQHLLGYRYISAEPYIGGFGLPRLPHTQVRGPHTEVRGPPKRQEGRPFSQ